MKGQYRRYLVRVSVAVAAFLVLASLVTACQQAEKPAAQSKAPLKIRIARTTGPASGGIFVADSQGMLTKNGLEATIKTFPSSADAVQALLAGDIDTAHPSAQIVNSLIDRGAEVVILAVASRSPKDMKVVVKSGIQGPADLKGKKIAATKGTTSEFLMLQYLKKGNLGTKDVEWVYADPPELVALLDRGEAEAFSLWEPFPSKALEVLGNRAKIVAVSEELGYMGSLFQITTKKVVQENPEALTRLLTALNEANQFIEKNPDKAAKDVAEATKMEVSQALPMVKAGQYAVVIDKPMVTELRAVGEWLKEGGRMKEVPDYQKYVETKFLKSVDPKLVNP